MNFQAYNELVLIPDTLSAVEVNCKRLAYEFNVQYPSYRGTYLSCIEEIEVTMDGQVVPREKTRFRVNGKEFLLSQMPELWSEYWFVLDRATIRVFDALAPGEHEIGICMRHRIPYAGYSGTYLTLVSSNSKKMKLEAWADAE